MRLPIDGKKSRSKIFSVASPTKEFDFFNLRVFIKANAATLAFCAQESKRKRNDDALENE